MTVPVPKPVPVVKKPVVKPPPPKKEEPKPEPKKEEPKPEPKPEPKKEEPKPIEVPEVPEMPPELPPEPVAAPAIKKKETKKGKTDPDCLLVSCSELVPLFQDNLKLKCDESFLEESAINSVQRSLTKHASGAGKAYKFIFVDLDDPTLMLGRFMVSLNKIMPKDDSVKIQVFACASTSSDRMLKKCEEVKVKFIPKPIFETKLRFVLKPHL